MEAVLKFHAARGNSWRDRVFTAADLQRRTFPPVSYCGRG